MRADLSKSANIISERWRGTNRASMARELQSSFRHSSVPKGARKTSPESLVPCLQLACRYYPCRGAGLVRPVSQNRCQIMSIADRIAAPPLPGATDTLAREPESATAAPSISFPVAGGEREL